MNDRRDEINYREASPELYSPEELEEETPKGPPGEPEQTMQPDPELLRSSAYYRRLFPEQAAALDKKEGRSQEDAFLEDDPSAPLIIVNKLSGHEILRVKGYNHTRGFRDCISQFKQDLSGGVIEGDLSGDDSFFEKSNFRNSQITASFKEANLQEAVFDNAELECNFNNANLAGASFRKVDLSRCSFKNANLTMADLRGATLPDKEKMAGAIMNNIRM